MLFPRPTPVSDASRTAPALGAGRARATACTLTPSAMCRTPSPRAPKIAKATYDAGVCPFSNKKCKGGHPCANAGHCVRPREPGGSWSTPRNREKVWQECRPGGHAVLVSVVLDHVEIVDSHPWADEPVQPLAPGCTARSCGDTDELDASSAAEDGG